MVDLLEETEFLSLIVPLAVRNITDLTAAGNAIGGALQWQGADQNKQLNVKLEEHWQF